MVELVNKIKPDYGLQADSSRLTSYTEAVQAGLEIEIASGFGFRNAIEPASPEGPSQCAQFAHAINTKHVIHILQALDRRASSTASSACSARSITIQR
jgi:hypothetical protein